MKSVKKRGDESIASQEKTGYSRKKTTKKFLI